MVTMNICGLIFQNPHGIIETIHTQVAMNVAVNLAVNVATITRAKTNKFKILCSKTHITGRAFTYPSLTIYTFVCIKTYEAQESAGSNNGQL